MIFQLLKHAAFLHSKFRNHSEENVWKYFQQYLRVYDIEV